MTNERLELVDRPNEREVVKERESAVRLVVAGVTMSLVRGTHCGKAYDGVGNFRTERP